MLGPRVLSADVCLGPGAHAHLRATHFGVDLEMTEKPEDVCE